MNFFCLTSIEAVPLEAFMGRRIADSRGNLESFACIPIMPREPHRVTGKSAHRFCVGIGATHPPYEAFLVRADTALTIPVEWVVESIATAKGRYFKVLSQHAGEGEAGSSHVARRIVYDRNYQLGLHPDGNPPTPGVLPKHFYMIMQGWAPRTGYKVTPRPLHMALFDAIVVDRHIVKGVRQTSDQLKVVRDPGEADFLLSVSLDADGESGRGGLVNPPVKDKKKGKVEPAGYILGSRKTAYGCSEALNCVDGAHNRRGDKGSPVNAVTGRRHGGVYALAKMNDGDLLRFYTEVGGEGTPQKRTTYTIRRTGQSVEWWVREEIV